MAKPRARKQAMHHARQQRKATKRRAIRAGYKPKTTAARSQRRQERRHEVGLAQYQNILRLGNLLFLHDAVHPTGRQGQKKLA